ncbi:ScbR family autoregulator-binding transcription factor [Streptomyces sp. NPDC048416]|uniref:ScbR family autoregulator-binding transcription factor n=1 Tax=Streptomyces sp. NPDC048416 TaxID=3365546 RepID=UPI00371D1A95
MAVQERALRTRNALIEAAAALFDRDGFETVSLAAISAHAGVSNGALHFHFASKAALADAVREAAARRLRRITEDGPARRGALQTLVDASHALARGFQDDVVLRAGFDLEEDPDSSRVGGDLHREWQSWVEAAFARADREGALMRGVSAQDAALMVVGAMTGFEELGGQDARWLSSATLTGFWALLLPRLAHGPVLDQLVASGTAPEAH